jgi:hypothetical protein
MSRRTAVTYETAPGGVDVLGEDAELPPITVTTGPEFWQKMDEYDADFPSNHRYRIVSEESQGGHPLWTLQPMKYRAVPRVPRYVRGSGGAATQVVMPDAQLRQIISTGGTHATINLKPDSELTSAQMETVPPAANSGIRSIKSGVAHFGYVDVPGSTEDGIISTADLAVGSTQEIWLARPAAAPGETLPEVTQTFLLLKHRYSVGEDAQGHPTMSEVDGSPEVSKVTLKMNEGARHSTSGTGDGGESGKVVLMTSLAEPGYFNKSDLMPVDVNVYKKDEIPDPNGVLVKKGDTVVYELTGTSESQTSLPAASTTWEYQQLKGDGSFDSWETFGGSGPSIENTESHAGIFKIRVKLATGTGTTYLDYTRKADAKFATNSSGLYNEELRAGRPDFVGVARGDVHFKIAKEARSKLGSTAWAKNTAIDIIPGQSAPAGAFKCNVFDYHIGNPVGAKIPWLWRTQYIPRAHEWDDVSWSIPDTRQDWYIDHPDDPWPPPSPPDRAGQTPAPPYINPASEEWTQDSAPEPGFVVSNANHRYDLGPLDFGNGHCGILDYDGAWISAGTANVNKSVHVSYGDDYKPAHFRSYGTP